MKKHMVSAMTVGAALVATAVGAAAPVSADSGAKGTGPVASGLATITADVARLDADADKALEKYWTAARMSAAKPAEVLIKGTPKELPTQKVAKGTPGSAAPSGTAAERANETFRITGYPNWGPNHPTARTVGKVFFTDPRNGLSYVCSAAVVNSEGKSTVWTAGHCVVNGGVWMTNWIFVPAYKNGQRPKGTWRANQLWTTSGWFYDGNYSYDIGAVVMRRLNGQKIVNRLGGQGIKWNWGDLPRVTALGYPHAAPFNGQRLYRVDGSTISDPFTGASTGT